MRFASKVAIILAMCAAALGQQKVNPATGISWPANCQVYNVAQAACPPVGVITFRGTWSSTTTYAANDAAYYSGSTYVSLQNSNLNQNPATATTYWTLLVSGGTSGIVAPANGGTGQDTSSSTGVPNVNAGAWSVSQALPNGTTVTTQTTGDSSGKAASDQFVATAVSQVGASVATDVIAASNSLVKVGATAVCSGTADQTCINTVISNRCAAGLGGYIVFLNGTYNLTGSINIPCANLTLSGQNKVMWGGYNHAAPCTIISPCGQLGTQGAILKASAAGFDLMTNTPNFPCGTGADQNERCRGLTIQYFYFQGFQYNNAAIVLTNSTDVSYIQYNMIQQTASGITCGCDTPYIEHNDIQDIGTGFGITTTVVNPTIENNLVWDSGGGCITSLAQASMIVHNFCGDLQTGIQAWAGMSKVSGNYMKYILPPFIDVKGFGQTIENNTMDNSGANFGTTPASSAMSWIRNDDTGTYSSVIGNTANTYSGQGGYFIDFTKATAADSLHSIACGNSLSGGWNGGSNAINLGSAVSCPNTPSYAGGQAYVSGTTYVAGSFVTYNGATYISIQSTTGNLPTNATYWTAITTGIPQAQYRATSITGVTSGNPITTWPDTSGWNGRALSVLTGGPKYESTGLINSGPTVRFVGSNLDLLQETELQFGIGQPRTVWLVVNMSNPNSNQGIIGGAGTSAPIFGTNNGSAKAAMFSGSCTITTCLSASALSGATTYIIEYNVNGTSSRIAVNGTSNAVTPNANSAAWSVGMIVGAAENGAGFTNYYTGDIGEIDVFSGGMSNTDANVEGAALCSLYAVTCSTSW